MSRTIKDKPSKLLHEAWDKDRVKLSNWYFIDLPTTKAKKRKEVDVEYHWMTTPSSWTRLMMNRPQRRCGHIWEKQILVGDIDECDPPGVSRKPHTYYW